ncbi:MAG: transcriptional repressor [Planctomycetes bacterium]|nr:transcriptional repressor [Planctomycetota bacterium]
MSQDSHLHSSKIAPTPRERFAEYLLQHGMRNTDQRRHLLEFVFSQHEHFNAEALIGRLPRRGERGHVSRPTVYRTLNEFVDAGLLRRFELDGRAVYEHDYGYPQHDHLHCQRCQKLFEFESQDLLSLRDRVAARRRFRVLGHRLIITGVCEACQRSERRRGRRAH